MSFPSSRRLLHADIVLLFALTQPRFARLFSLWLFVALFTSGAIGSVYLVYPCVMFPRVVSCCGILHYVVDSSA